jgi:ethanolamine transporter EutH
MFKIVLTTLFYLSAYIINGLLILYLNKLESNKCKCVKNTNFHYTLKSCIYSGLLIPIVYVLLLGFALITKDNILYYSLQQVYRLLIILINGIITCMVFAYIHLLNKNNDCDCINNGKTKKVHKALNILRYIMLVGYGLYLVIYINLKYFNKPKIVLVNNIQKRNKNSTPLKDI